MIDISILIPVYNASGFINEAVDQLVPFLKSSGRSFEVLMCDDASTDDSRRILASVAQKRPEIKLLFNEDNRGLGFTLRRLIKEAQGTYLVYLDCDLPFGIAGLPDILKELDQYDIVVMSRYAGKKNTVAFLRRMASRFYYVLCRILFKVSVRDIGSGMVGLRAESVKQLKLGADRFDFHAELYVKAQQQNLRIKELGALNRSSHTGSFSILKHGAATLIDTVRLKSHDKKE